MKNTKTFLCTALSAIALSACGGSSGSSSTPSEDISVDTIYGPYSTGSVSEPSFTYFDLDTMTTVSLTEEEAASDTVWDVAFKRSSVYLNHNADREAVSAYFTENNADFFDEDGNAVTDMFVNATPESELEDFTSVTADDIPADSTLFVSDVTSNIIDGFYNYDSTTHVVTAAPENYFIVYSDDTFTKFNVTDLTTSGYYMSEITISYANQTSSDTEFNTTTTDLIVDAAATCAGYGGVYIDFDLGQTVSEADDWDLSLSCSEDLSGVNFSIDIADDATAMQDFDDYYTAIDLDAINYYDFEANEYSVKVFDETSWYQYGVNGGHTLWSQYGVYLLKTETATYKFQITSYYDTDGTSGNLSFRAEAL